MAESAPPLYYSTPIPILAPPNSNEFSTNQQSLLSSNYTISNDNNKEVSEQAMKQLMDQGFTQGLAESLAESSVNFPLRLWVVDNSGSMQKTDGHLILESSKQGKVQISNCTRWNEIKEAVTYHINLSSLLEVPTSFRFLNHPGATVGSQQFDIVMEGAHTAAADVENAMSIMSRAKPGGCTPLTKHILDIHRTVLSLAPQLKATGKRVVIVLATDGLPTDDVGNANASAKQQFTQSLRKLEGLPVWVVIRLCTDEDDVVDFYNQLDDDLELNMDVLDDFCGEASEVYEHNSWLNYALPLHRMREMGFHDRLFDMLDERPLTKGELREFCVLLFGIKKSDGIPDPSIDWKGFLSDIERLLKDESQQWNPMKKKVSPW
eukprot:CAMPEP_0197825544 /NCGR_PEP_ID=MMETSP1437-20131217/2598_1 /TAXON_ID=49252 ORGANISM="Eucampia antarctica, Strain CCMP1452" /NCGR_SAMPLE_ID=MMETSP1437 /ASSEMBLY_ACC=CAM_ASM_001096 /LENGTH=376 /DNA_ID=CAMNT_0043425571 /DNA_START=47 /DNA_END=1174 /DNA_ORIENTATION=+